MDPTLQKYTELAGRVLLAAVFLIGGLGKIGGYESTAGYMESYGVPGLLLPLVILVEVVGAVAIIAGFQTRWAALVLALFCVLSAGIFHTQFDDQVQFVMFFKNLAMAGGFLILAVHGAGALSLDARKR